MNKEAMEMWIMLANKHNCSNCKHGGWGQKCHDCVFDHSEEWCEEYGNRSALGMGRTKLI